MNIQTATINLAAAHVAAGKSVEEAAEATIAAMMNERPDLAMRLFASLAK